MREKVFLKRTQCVSFFFLLVRFQVLHLSIISAVHRSGAIISASSFFFLSSLDPLFLISSRPFLSSVKSIHV